MTDHDTPAAHWARIDAQHAARRRLTETAIQHNKAVLFDALATTGITAVIVEFDGAGGSGQIESISAINGKDAAVLPDARIASQFAADDGSVLNGNQLPLVTALEGLVFQCLTASQEGWENNAGAYGTFTFDVVARTICHEHHARFETIDTSHHSW